MNRQDEKDRNFLLRSNNNAPQAEGDDELEVSVHTETDAWEEYPPPQIPSRLLKWVIGGCILVTLVIVTLFILYIIFSH